jgi:hypothetical protein
MWNTNRAAGAALAVLCVWAADTRPAHAQG